MQPVIKIKTTEDFCEYQEKEQYPKNTRKDVILTVINTTKDGYYCSYKNEYKIFVPFKYARITN